MVPLSIRQQLDLTGRHAIITGGTGWLGAHMSQSLLELGAEVFAISRGQSKDYASELGLDDCATFHRVVGDLSTKEGCDKALEQCLSVYTSILVNNSFSWPKKLHLYDFEWDDAMRTMEAGVVSPMYITRRVMGTMMVSSVSNRGSIINVSSMYGHVSPDQRIYQDRNDMGNAMHYGAAKAALLQTTRYVAEQGGKFNIRCNSISPGPFPRPGAFEPDKGWFKEELEKKTMLGRVGRPEELKGAVAFLASDMSSYITGADVSIDGGWTAW